MKNNVGVSLSILQHFNILILLSNHNVIFLELHFSISLLFYKQIIDILLRKKWTKDVIFKLLVHFSVLSNNTLYTVRK